MYETLTAITNPNAIRSHTTDGANENAVAVEAIVIGLRIGAPSKNATLSLGATPRLIKLRATGTLPHSHTGASIPVLASTDFLKKLFLGKILNKNSGLIKSLILVDTSTPITIKGNASTMTLSMSVMIVCSTSGICIAIVCIIVSNNAHGIITYMFRNFVLKKLESYVRLYFEKHPNVRLVVVTGSVGKTSTKHAIATILSERLRVRMHEGNHNSEFSAPLAILGINYPGKIKSIIAWLKVFRAARLRIRQEADVDVIVQELGADKPGDIARFGQYLRPDIAVVTAVTPEHMEFFQTMEAVAQEELSAANFSKLALINRYDIEEKYAQYLTNANVDTYGTTATAEYRFEVADFTVKDGYAGRMIGPEFSEGIPTVATVYGEHSLRPVAAGAAVAAKLGLDANAIAAGIDAIRPVPGRMNMLRGINGIHILDDTYNSSPAAALAALQALYSLEAPQRIAIIGSMNELGATSADEHRNVGEKCDPSLLSWVITIGDDANNYLAPAAKHRGCQVKTFQSAIDAGAFARSVIEFNAAILVKGSQNNIYAEEAVKVLCDMTEDLKLVRQEPEWIEKKKKFFSKV